MASENGFDKVVPYYDQLALMIFGNSLLHAQRYLFSRVKNDTRVLVVGGGTGWWLKEFFQFHPSCHVVFVDTSYQMINRARKNSGDDQRIQFVHGTISSVVKTYRFDYVITSCFLDLFKEDELNWHIQKILKFLSSGGHWMVTDFVNTRWWHAVLLFVMYRFFNLMTALKTTCLPRWDEIMRNQGLVATDEKRYYGGFIKSVIYKSG